MPGTKSVRKKASSKPRNATRKKKNPPAKPQLKHVPWDSVPLETLNPLLQRQFMVGHKIMLSRILLKKGSVVPLHSHHNEQISYVIEGSLVFSIDDREITVKAGEVLAIPPHMPHRVSALADSISLDIFNPPRQDWITGTDQYLRGQ